MSKTVCELHVIYSCINFHIDTCLIHIPSACVLYILWFDFLLTIRVTVLIEWIN